MLYFYTPKYAKQNDTPENEASSYGPLIGVDAKFAYDICQTKS
jgi:hypothetical protein